MSAEIDTVLERFEADASQAIAEVKKYAATYDELGKAAERSAVDMQTHAGAVAKLGANLQVATDFAKGFADGLHQVIDEELAAGRITPQLAEELRKQADELAKAGKAAGNAAGGHDKHTSSLLEWKREAGRSREAAQFLVSALSGIAPTSSAAGAGLRLLAAVAVGGGGLVLALEAVHFATTLVSDALEASRKKQEEAEKAAKDHADALEALRRKSDDYLVSLAGAPHSFTAFRDVMRDADRDAAQLTTKIAALREELVKLDNAARAAGGADMTAELDAALAREQISGLEKKLAPIRDIQGQAGRNLQRDVTAEEEKARQDRLTKLVQVGESDRQRLTMAAADAVGESDRALLRERLRVQVELDRAESELNRARRAELEKGGVDAAAVNAKWDDAIAAAKSVRNDKIKELDRKAWEADVALAAQRADAREQSDAALLQTTIKVNEDRAEHERHLYWQLQAYGDEAAARELEANFKRFTSLRALEGLSLEQSLARAREYEDAKAKILDEAETRRAQEQAKREDDVTAEIIAENEKRIHVADEAEALRLTHGDLARSSELVRLKTHYTEILADEKLSQEERKRLVEEYEGKKAAIVSKYQHQTLATAQAGLAEAGNAGAGLAGAAALATALNDWKKFEADKTGMTAEEAKKRREILTQEAIAVGSVFVPMLAHALAGSLEANARYTARFKELSQQRRADDLLETGQAKSAADAKRMAADEAEAAAQLAAAAEKQKIADVMAAQAMQWAIEAPVAFFSPAMGGPVGAAVRAAGAVAAAALAMKFHGDAVSIEQGRGYTSNERDTLHNLEQPAGGGAGSGGSGGRASSSSDEPQRQIVYVMTVQDPFETAAEVARRAARAMDLAKKLDMQRRQS
jgi:hypothetical protein